MKGCRSCRNWQAIDEHLDREDPATLGLKVQIGLCRRYAPHPATLEDDAGLPARSRGFAPAKAGAAPAVRRVESWWPRVPSDGWCGEWDPEVN